MFSNCKHCNNNTTDAKTGHLIDEYVEEIDWESQTNYQLKILFPEMKAKKYNLPTTCCWTLYDSMIMSKVFNHKQNFIITEARM